MYMCPNCGRTREELPTYKIPYEYGMGYVFDEETDFTCMCGDDYQVASVCEECGEYFVDEDKTGLCEKCLDEYTSEDV